MYEDGKVRECLVENEARKQKPASLLVLAIEVDRGSKAGRSVTPMIGLRTTWHRKKESVFRSLCFTSARTACEVQDRQ